MSRKWIYVAGGIVAVFLLLVVLVPMFVNVNSYRPRIESLLGTAINRKVSIGNIRLSILSGGVSTEDVSISDDPAFSGGNFLTALSISVGVKLLPLIFSRQLEVTGITIEKPEINLIRSASGKWNFSTLGPAAGSAPASSASSAPSVAAQPASSSGSSASSNVSVQRLNIRDGKLSIIENGPTVKPLAYDQLNLEVSDLSYTTQFPFQFSVRSPGNGSIKLSGKAGPLNQADMQQTPLEANLDIRNLDLADTGLVDAASGIAGRLDFTGDLNSDGKQVHSKGTVTAAKLQLVPGSTPAGQPVKLDYDTDYQLPSQGGALNQCAVHIGKALAHLAGSFNAAGQEPSVQMRLTGEGMPVSDLESVLPAVGVTLPSGASLRDGTMNVNLAIAGPVNRLVISGPASIANARLANFDLGSKLGVLGPFAGVKKGADTVIQTFSSDLRVANEGIRADKINLVVEGIGGMTGSGTVGADHSLNFRMAAQLSGGGAIGAVGDLTRFTGQGGKGGGIPFLIHGTTSDPIFLPDVAGVAGNLGKGILGGGQGAASGAETLGGALGGLFGKGKKP